MLERQILPLKAAAIAASICAITYPTWSQRRFSLNQYGMKHLCACGLDIGEVIWHKASGHSFVAECMMLAVQQAVSPHKAAASTGP